MKKRWREPIKSGMIKQQKIKKKQQQHQQRQKSVNVWNKRGNELFTMCKVKICCGKFCDSSLSLWYFEQSRAEIPSAIMPSMAYYHPRRHSKKKEDTDKSTQYTRTHLCTHSHPNRMKMNNMKWTVLICFEFLIYQNSPMPL